MEIKKGSNDVNELNATYSKLRQEYSTMFRLILDFEDEKKEHL